MDDGKYRDIVDPQHYKRFRIEPFDFLYQNNIPYPESHIIPYLLRWPYKDGIQDLYKARQLLNMLIERVEGAMELEEEMKREKDQNR